MTTVSPTDFAPGEIHVQLKIDEVSRADWAKLEASLKQVKHVTYCKLFVDNSGETRGHIVAKVSFGNLRGIKRNIAFDEIVSKISKIVNHKLAGQKVDASV